jgi:hypothetical protein
MSTPVRALRRALAGLLLLNLTVVLGHHDKAAPVVTVGTIIEPGRTTPPPPLAPLTTTTIVATTTTVMPRPSKFEDRRPLPTSADVHAAIAAHFGDLYDQAIAVANCESSLDADARSPGNYGLFQINRVHADQWLEVIGQRFDDTWHDPDHNAEFARWLYDREGWRPWSCRWAA